MSSGKILGVGEVEVIWGEVGSEFSVLGVDVIGREDGLGGVVFRCEVMRSVDVKFGRFRGRLEDGDLFLL